MFEADLDEIDGDEEDGDEDDSDGDNSSGSPDDSPDNKEELVKEEEDKLVKETIAENPPRQVGIRPEWRQNRPSSLVHMMTIPQLRAFMKMQGIKCNSCVEKAQMIDAVKSVPSVERYTKHQAHEEDDNKILQKRVWAQRERDSKKKEQVQKVEERQTKERAIKEHSKKMAEKRAKQQKQEKDGKLALKAAQDAARVARAEMAEHQQKLQVMQAKVKESEQKAAQLLRNAVAGTEAGQA